MAGKTPAATPASTPAPTTTSSPRPRTGTSRAQRVLTATAEPVETGAAFVLGLLFWGWVGLPFLKAGPAGGPKAVRDVLRAKFFNKGSDGAWLP